MNRNIWATILASAVGAFAFEAGAAEITIRLGTTDPLALPYGQALVEFEKIVEAESDGRIDVQLFPSNQLGDIVEQIESVRAGVQEMAVSTPAWFSQFYAPIEVLELPFLVTSWEEVDALRKSEALESLLADASAQTDIKIIGAFPFGFRSVINSQHPIETIEDFDGLKLRLQNSPIHLETFRALGANPISVSWGETYQAVQTGVVDGLENSLALLHSNGFHEVAPYISLTRHFSGMLLVYINPSFLEGLDEGDREILINALQQAEEINFGLVQEAEAVAETALREDGAKINEISTEALAEMREAVRPVYESAAERFGEHLDSIRSVVAN